MVVEEGIRGNSVSIALERVEQENLMVALSTPRDKREEREVANGAEYSQLHNVMVYTSTAKLHRFLLETIHVVCYQWLHSAYCFHLSPWLLGSASSMATIHLQYYSTLPRPFSKSGHLHLKDPKL